MPTMITHSAQRKVAFVTASTDHGTMIVNRFDQSFYEPEHRGFGVGFQLLDTSSYDAHDVAMLLWLLDLRRAHRGNGVVALDAGANIGVFTVEMARHMTGWGAVMAVEAQERIYYALCGNIAINNCFNAKAVHAAIAMEAGSMKMPRPDYTVDASFGSLELRQRENTEFIGQEIDYADDKMIRVRTANLDSFTFPRIDLIKIDIEGMETEAIAGGVNLIAAQRPILVVEKIKADQGQLRAMIEFHGYWVADVGMNFLAVHRRDPCQPEAEATFSTRVEPGGKASNS